MKLNQQQKEELHSLLKQSVVGPNEMLKVVQYYIYVRKGQWINIEHPSPWQERLHSYLLVNAFENACNWFGENFNTL